MSAVMKKNLFSFLVVVSVTTCSNNICADEKAEHTQKPWYKRIFISEKRTLSTMDYEQLCEAKSRALANNDTLTACKYLERMSKLCSDLETLRTIVLELADLLFKDKAFSKAYLLYDQYVKSYPGKTDDYMRAYYHKILCSYYQQFDIERDQTATEQTLELCNSFLTDCKSSTYEKDVQTVIRSCKKSLASSELSIAQHYIVQNRVISANRRVARIRDAYLTVPDVEQQLIGVEIALAEKVGNTQFAQAKRKELMEKFPEQKSVVVAQGKKAKNMAHRF